jgi:ZIP family zinc transporter/zinc and cadmium transporter
VILLATQLFNTVLYGSIAGISTLIGILVVVFAKEFTKKYSVYLVSFSAGILITFGLVNLASQSLELYKYSLWIILAGILLFYLIEHFIMLHPFHEPKERMHAMGKTVALGLGFHSLIDGIVIGAGFEISHQVGLMSTLAVVAHEFPEGITSMAVLLHVKVKKILAFLYSILIAIATPIGAILTYYLINNLSKEILGILLALAAGSFIYVGASDLIPETHENYKKMNALYFVIGILFVILIGYIFG